MKTEVLICGAGPSGLSAALYLASRGRKVVVIDKNKGRTDKSKAVGVQPGTLELLTACFGEDLSREMVDAGILAREFFFHTDNGKIFPIKFALVPSPYNALLVLRQSETERLFEEHLARAGVTVLREHELTSFTQDASGVRAQAGGLKIEADYLIGCDGAHSAVRRGLGFDFKGGTYDGEFILADLKVKWPWDYNCIHTFVGGPGAAAFFPLKGDRDYRLILIPRQGAPQSGETGELDIAEVRREAAPYLQGAKIELSDPVWTARFHVHHRMTAKMGEGRVFLSGDAAHIHSPLGAQGMNTGIQDSIDLGWRLDRILAGKAGPELLEGFLRERHKNAKQVVGFTDMAFRTVFAPESFFTKAARRQILPRIMSRPAIQKIALRYISEIDVARKIASHAGEHP
jgi:2-polyprenyl-6-methoxyphenol hydroxylase-like FAD-dependent oxidoreductase